MLYPVIGEPWQFGSSHLMARQDDDNLAGTLFSTSCNIGTTAGTVAGVVTMPVPPNIPTPNTFKA
jgi:predicted MFS family arabinose efflux permease